MSLRHVHKNSGVANKAPLPSDIGHDEIAINWNASGPFLSIKDSNGNIRRLSIVALENADPIGAIEGAIEAHVSEPDPHEQYALKTEFNNDIDGINEQIALITSRLSNLQHTNCIYVSLNGNDLNNTGTSDSPFRTIGAAAAAAMPGDVVFIAPGTYVEPLLPIRWRYDVTVFGSGLRSTIVQPASDQQLKDVFKVDSGFWAWGISFAGHQADDTHQSWAISFNELADNSARGAIGLGAFILKSPYIQNCTSITAEDDGGVAGSQSTGNTGGGIKVDGSQCAVNSPIRSMVVDSYTQVNLGGPGCLVLNDGYAQLVSFFGTFCTYHVRCESGGQVNLSGGGTTDFGIYGLMADGYSSRPLYTASARISAYGATRRQRSVTIDTSTDVFSSSDHQLVAGDQIKFELGSGEFPTGLASNTIYHVISAGLNSGSFKVSTTSGGASINMSGSANGNYTFVRQGATEVDVVSLSANRLGRQIKYPTAGSLGSPGSPVTVTSRGGSAPGSTFTVTLGASTIAHEYVGGGSVTVAGSSYPITSASYNNSTGVAIFTATGYGPTIGDSVTLSGLSFICNSASRPNAGQLMFPQLVFPRNASTGLPEAKTFAYTRVSSTVFTYSEAASPAGPDHDYTGGGTVIIGGTDYGIRSATYNKNSGLVTITTIIPLPEGNGSVTVSGLKFICPTSAYVVTSSVPIDIAGNTVENGSPTAAGYRVNFFSELNGGLQNVVVAGQTLDFRNRSQVSAPSHTFEFVGSGTNYDALPWNGGVPVPSNAIVETNNGKVYSSNTNEKGDFAVGSQFSVDGTTGSVTINTDQFNLSGLNFIGPFSRNGGISTVGEQLREISNNTSLIASTGAPDGNTAPTQFAVKSYSDNKFLVDITVTAGLPISIIDTSTVNSQGFWTRSRRIELSMNVANGLVKLDSGGLIPSTLLPSYVDDVLEFATYSAFPAIGETGKIYLDLSNSRSYRWTGSTYMEIKASPGSSDEIIEGSVNLFYTTSRARNAISAAAGSLISYNPSTGIFDFSYGTLGTPQFASVGFGVAPATGWSQTVGSGVIQRLRTITIATNTYTIDVLLGNEFATAAAITGNTGITLSNTGQIPSGYIWRGVLSFTYTSGSVTWFSGFTVKWDGNTAPFLTPGETESFVITVTGGSTTINVAPMRGAA